MHTCILVADDGDIYKLLAPFADYMDDSSVSGPKIDYFSIGGCYEGALPLKKPRRLRKWFGMLPAGETTRASVARKSEIDQEAFLSDPPDALFFRGQLVRSPFSLDHEADTKWQAEFRQRFASIPDDALLKIVDAHI